VLPPPLAPPALLAQRFSSPVNCLLYSTLSQTAFALGAEARGCNQQEAGHVDVGIRDLSELWVSGISGHLRTQGYEDADSLRSLIPTYPLLQGAAVRHAAARGVFVRLRLRCLIGGKGEVDYRGT
jgi:hypothetical protein